MSWWQWETNLTIPKDVHDLMAPVSMSKSCLLQTANTIGFHILGEPDPVVKSSPHPRIIRMRVPAQVYEMDDWRGAGQRAVVGAVRSQSGLIDKQSLSEKLGNSSLNCWSYKLLGNCPADIDLA
jgi:hypothetical protein